MRKPVIYFFPPATLPNATVSVTIVPQWTFTHVYPLVAAKRVEDGRQEISWTVAAEPDGTLMDKATGLELSYLFWEATGRCAPPPSPPLLPIDGTLSPETERFDPGAPSLSPDSPTAVLLSFAELLPYLDSVLRALAFHTAARNDFITYWLPALSRKPYVALRFLPQAVYERAAELRVEPRPDVVTRAMMLFRSVGEGEVLLWADARRRVATVHWAAVVGVRASEAQDTSLFRVLEWGAIEVL